MEFGLARSFESRASTNWRQSATMQRFLTVPQARSTRGGAKPGKLSCKSILTSHFHHFVRVAVDVLGDLLTARTLVELSSNAMLQPVAVTIVNQEGFDSLLSQASGNCSPRGEVGSAGIGPTSFEK
jgi:hypothetical protein